MTNVAEESLDSFECTVLGEEEGQLAVHSITSDGSDIIIHVDMTGVPPWYRQPGSRFRIRSLLNQRNEYSFITKGRDLHYSSKLEDLSFLSVSQPKLNSWLMELFQGGFPASFRVEALEGAADGLRLCFSTVAFNVTLVSTGCAGLLTGTARPKQPHDGEPPYYVLGMGRYEHVTWTSILAKLLTLEIARSMFSSESI